MRAQLECPVDPVQQAELSQVLARVARRGSERARVQIVGIPRDLTLYTPQQLEMREHLDEVSQSMTKPSRFAEAIALHQYFERTGSRRALSSACETALVLSASHTVTEHEPRDRWCVCAGLQQRQPRTLARLLLTFCSGDYGTRVREARETG